MKTITVAGLGPGELNQLPLGVYRAIKEAKEIIVRTEDHPAVQELKEEGIVFRSFDYIYEEVEEDFGEVYRRIVQQLLEKAETQEILYLVPGHPMVAEQSVQFLLEAEHPIDIIGGKSFIDELFGAVQADPIEGFQLLDAFDLHHDQINTGQHIIIMQVFSSLIASEVKLSLMEKYEDTQDVCVVDAAGSSKQQIKWIKLFELDRFDDIHNLRSVYIPPVERDKRTTSFETLQYYMDEIIQHDLWINEHTHESLLPYLKEEADELTQAFEKGDIENAIEELGDVLLQVLYHSGIGEREGEFTLEEVLDHINRKLRRRHPHVFDGEEAHTLEEIDAIWQRIKREEKGLDEE